MLFSLNRPYTGSLQAAVFDWAGTTVDYGCVAPAVVFLQVFEKYGVPITMEQAREPMGKAKRDHILDITLNDDVNRQWQEKHGILPGSDDVDRMYADFIPKQIQCIADYADLIPGTIEVIADLRRRGLKIGSTTGYSKEMMDVLEGEAERRGYKPDNSVCASDVPAGRPSGWMAVKSAVQLGVYPMEACVKVGDTVPDIYEGVNAGMWSVGVVMTGNEIGMTLDELARADRSIVEKKRDDAYRRMQAAGAHYIVDTISDIPAVVDDINRRMGRGETP